MNKLNSKNWVKVRINTQTKEITFTTQYFKTQSEGMTTVKTNQYLIVNKSKLEKMLADGWMIKGKEVKSTKEVKTPWTPKYIVGDPAIEAQIQAYVNKKKSQCAVDFSTTAHIHEMSDTAKQFLASAPKPQKVEPFNYDEKHAKYIKKREREIKRQKESEAYNG